MSDKNIMIFRLGSLGDTLIALPLFNRIKEIYPNSKIILLSNKPIITKAAPIESVLGNNFFFNEIVNYSVGTRNILNILRMIFTIRSKRIHELFYLTQGRSSLSLKRDLIFFKLAGIKKFSALPNKIEDFKLVFDKQTGRYEWEAKRLARRLGYPEKFNFIEEKYWDLHLTNDEIKKGNEFIKSFTPGVLNICLSIGTKLQSNDWGLDNWVKLIIEISKKFPDANIIFIGAEDEKKLTDHILKFTNNKSFNFCGKFSPRVSAVIMRNMDIFIGQDSGPIHLAGTMGIPIVGIYSSRNLKGQWFPRGKNKKIIYKEVDCAGCHLEECLIEKKKCILSIDVIEVQNAIIEILNTSKFLLTDKFI